MKIEFLTSCFSLLSSVNLIFEKQRHLKIKIETNLGLIYLDYTFNYFCYLILFSPLGCKKSFFCLFKIFERIHKVSKCLEFVSVEDQPDRKLCPKIIDSITYISTFNLLLFNLHKFRLTLSKECQIVGTV